jgi:hypothetical protein
MLIRFENSNTHTWKQDTPMDCRRKQMYTKTNTLSNKNKTGHVHGLPTKRTACLPSVARSRGAGGGGGGGRARARGREGGRETVGVAIGGWERERQSGMFERGRQTGTERGGRERKTVCVCLFFRERTERERFIHIFVA